VSALSFDRDQRGDAAADHRLLSCFPERPHTKGAASRLLNLWLSVRESPDKVKECVPDSSGCAWILPSPIFKLECIPVDMNGDPRARVFRKSMPTVHQMDFESGKAFKIHW
jgi:hypothetical protein